MAGSQGLVEESGRPRHPVTVKIMGSNPIGIAVIFGWLQRTFHRLVASIWLELIPDKDAVGRSNRPEPTALRDAAGAIAAPKEHAVTDTSERRTTSSTAAPRSWALGEMEITRHYGCRFPSSSLGEPARPTKAVWRDQPTDGAGRRFESGCPQRWGVRVRPPFFPLRRRSVAGPWTLDPQTVGFDSPRLSHLIRLAPVV